MEELVRELIDRHKRDKDLSTPEVQDEVKKLREKHNKVLPTNDIMEFGQLVGLDWSEVNLKGYNFQSVALSSQTYSANFENATFHLCNFKNAFMVGANCRGAGFFICNLKETFLQYIILENGYLVDTDVRDANFLHGKIEGIDLVRVNVEEAKYFETTIFDKINEYHPRKAWDTYRYLIPIFKNKGKTYKAASLYYRAQINHGLALRESSQLVEKFQGYWNWVKWLFTGYGEKPKRLGLIVIITIVGYAALYYFSKGLCTDTGTGFSNGLDYIYFSIVTFTTLGFGDIKPISDNNFIRMVAATEALFGAIIMALFVILLSNKLLRT